MKKVILAGAFAIIGISALTSCKKDYECKVGGVTYSECNACGSTEKSAFETSCSLIGGSVSQK